MKYAELQLKHRPTKLNEMVGQDTAIDDIKRFIKRNQIPHAILFTGPSGCGKTTLARILKRKLKCSDDDFNEINIGDFTGIETVRGIRMHMQLMPMGGNTRIWLIDEAHQMTKQAQNAFLKILEEPPDWVYFFLATTAPGRLLPTIRTRCTEIAVHAVSPDKLAELVQRIAANEDATLEDYVIDKIVDRSEGSPRKALVLLNQIMGESDPEQQVEIIISSDIEKEGIDICRLLFKDGTTWKTMASTLRSVKQDPEELRWIILKYANKVLINGGGRKADRANEIITRFEEPFYNTKHAGLSSGCYDLIRSRQSN